MKRYYTPSKILQITIGIGMFIYAFVGYEPPPHEVVAFVGPDFWYFFWYFLGERTIEFTIGIFMILYAIPDSNIERNVSGTVRGILQAMIILALLYLTYY